MLHGALGMSSIFFIIALIFFIFKDKACILIGGYNVISKEQRKNYDELRLSKAYGVNFLKYGLIFLVGGIGCILISDICFWIAFLVWIIYFFRNVGFSNKVFDKYKK